MKLVEVRKFLRWALSTGQEMAKELHYAPLPSKLITALKGKIK